jgi:hypothetical protein
MADLGSASRPGPRREPGFVKLTSVINKAPLSVNASSQARLPRFPRPFHGLFTRLSRAYHALITPLPPSTSPCRVALRRRRECTESRRGRFPRLPLPGNSRKCTAVRLLRTRNEPSPVELRILRFTQPRLGHFHEPWARDFVPSLLINPSPSSLRPFDSSLYAKS